MNDLLMEKQEFWCFIKSFALHRFGGVGEKGTQTAERSRAIPVLSRERARPQGLDPASPAAVCGWSSQIQYMQAFLCCGGLHLPLFAS